ncbi:hypothetical protein SAMN04488074_111212 [Lentzea albidocapillata subsp. violacea]|uniref:DUF3558 domain-containing protein n=1 Tax=Lentzea albidocapillata subsp. violacea TaxID=128104 RepID=A0A1G9KR86_9PSEU|nr:hypothetical protein SAMN04488074_111212 [Lentzea albidocapillata subsp. violacea]
MHVVPRFRATAVVAAAALLMAGCATGPGLAKTNSPRRTVQAGADTTTSTDPSVKQSAQPGKPVDPAFAPERLRLINPCALIEKELLQTVGTPSRYSSSSYTRCANYMKDKAGKTLNITLDIGYSLTSTELKKATKQIAGLRSGEQKLSNTSCFISAVTQESPAQAVRLQVNTGTGGSEACEPGRKVLEGVVRKLRGNPQKYSPPKGSPVEVDPCAIVEKSTLAPVLGASPRALPYGLHQCSWTGQSAQMQIEFKTARIPKDGKFDSRSVETDLGGGLKGYQSFRDGAFPTCELVLIRTRDQDDAGEIVEFIVAASKEKELDRCQAAQAFAKAVLPLLPQA